MKIICSLTLKYRSLTDHDDQDGAYTLIHIPLHLYSSLLQPILRVLLPETQSFGASRTGPEHELQGLTSDTHQHAFLNISVTPMEVSIVCHSSWARNVFQPAIANLPREAARSIELSKNDHMILSVISAGMDAAGRVMELTSPLALAGIPIFFISTYYSDFILVPAKEKEKVVKALQTKGLELAPDQSQFINPTAYGRATPPTTETPASEAPNLQELENRAFDLLKKRNVSPRVETDLELVQCSGREVSPAVTEIYDRRSSISRSNGAGQQQQQTWVDHVDTKLYTCIISALVSQPRFISITLAQDDPPSLLLDKTLLPIFGDSLVGDTEGRHVPIFLDLGSLPPEVTGIVCGVAGKLVRDMDMTESSELSYLSTARAGAVILPDGQAKRALEVLQPVLSKEEMGKS